LVLAHVFLGMLAGLLGLMAALALGASFWEAILLYSLIGSFVAGLSPVVSFAVGGLRTWRQRGNRSTVDLDCMAESGSAASPTGFLQDSGADLKILAVDDDDFIRELLPRIAATVGQPDMVTARSGMEALELLRRGGVAFDCFLLDINMPEMDGIELCAHIRGMPNYRDAPVIMLTAMTDMDHVERAFLAGATDYTSKPFDIIEFGERLRVAEAGKAARKAAALEAIGGDASSLELTPAAPEPPPQVSPLKGIPALIEPAALGNYVARLSGAALTGGYAMAFLVEHESDIQRQVPATVRSLALTEVAAGIDEVMGPHTYLMALLEMDHFVVVVSNGARLPDPIAIEASVQKRVDKGLAAAANQDGWRVKLSVGAAVRLGSGRTQRARVAFESAIVLARDRAARRADMPRSRASVQGQE